MSWVRVMVANYLTSSGKEWSDTFSKQNGGTYNNRAQSYATELAKPPERHLLTTCDQLSTAVLSEWFVVDNKVFSPGKPVTKDLLWVLEQIPGEQYCRKPEWSNFH